MCPPTKNDDTDAPSLKEALARFNNRKRLWSNVFADPGQPTPCSGSDLRFKVNEQGELVVCAATPDLCEIDTRAARIAGQVVDALATRTDVQPDTSVTQFQFDHAPRHPILFPSIDPSNGIMTIPRAFLDNDHVGDELITFFLLHEAAHRIDRTFSELEADAWAINQGLPSLLRVARSAVPEADLRERIACQFAGFYGSVYKPRVLRYAIRCGGAIYPSMACRLAIIRGEYPQHPIEQVAGCAADTVECDLEQLHPAAKPFTRCRPVCAGCPNDARSTCDPVWIELLGASYCQLGNEFYGERCRWPEPYCNTPPSIMAGTMRLELPAAKRHVRKLKRDLDRAHRRLTRFRHTIQKEDLTLPKDL